MPLFWDECVFSFAIKPQCLMRSMSLACSTLFLIRRSLISPDALRERKLSLVNSSNSGLHLRSCLMGSTLSLQYASPARLRGSAAQCDAEHNTPSVYAVPGS